MNPKDLFDLVKLLLKEFFGENVPSLVTDLVSIGVLFTVLVTLLFTVFIGFGKAVKVFREDIRPLFYDDTERRRAEKRRRFADHVESEIRRIDNAEEWGDYKFAELEAEVEAEGKRRGIPFLHKGSGLRRERSLSRALRHSKERLILLEGEPGSGKSVALRYMTSMLARVAMEARNTSTVIPLYLNLKNIDRRPGVAVDAELIRSHVLKTLNRPNTRNIGEFLDQEFERGMQEGTWLFLFDSFDEIPDILSATSADTTVRDYANAIADFLLTLNRCRGIVASRYFRGPGGLAWPRFRILPLSDSYRRNLIHRSDLDPASARALIGEVELALGDLNVMTRNPMFLGLLCEYMHTARTFPENAHVVFEKYVTTRLEWDQTKLQVRFGTDAAAVRSAAEYAAFCMASTPRLGLSPARAELMAAMKANGFDRDPEAMLEAIEYIKLARTDEHDRTKTFTFAHRRFQEYFATCVVIREPALVPAEALLTDARWRETAVVLLQTQTDVSTLLAQAQLELTKVVREIEVTLPSVPSLQEIEQRAERPPRIQFHWPPVALHLLSLLQSGFRGRPEKLPDEIRVLAGRIVLTATWVGSLSDRRWVLEVAETAPQDVLMFALRSAYHDRSAWLGDVAYRQAGALRMIPPDIAKEIRFALVSQFLSGRLRGQKHATHAYLSRLPTAKKFLEVLNLLLIIQPVDLALHFVLLVALVWTRPEGAKLAALLGLVVIAFYYTSYIPNLKRFNPRMMLIVAYPRLALIVPFLFTLSTFPKNTSSVKELLGSMARAFFWPSSILILITLWAPMAVVVAANGRFTRPVLWPLPFLLPVTRILQSLGNIPRLIRTLFAQKISLVLSDFLQVIAGISITGSVLYAIVAFATVGYVALAIIAIVGTVILAITLALFVKDRLRLADYYRRTTPWTADELLNAIQKIEQEGRQAGFIRYIRERSLVFHTEDHESSIRCFALSLENQRHFSTILLDELNILAEQLRAQRAASGLPAGPSTTESLGDITTSVVDMTV